MKKFKEYLKVELLNWKPDPNPPAMFGGEPKKGPNGIQEGQSTGNIEGSSESAPSPAIVGGEIQKSIDTKQSSGQEA